MADVRRHNRRVADLHRMGVLGSSLQMTRPARFSLADVERALRAAEKRGLNVSGYEIDPNGTIRILTGASQAANDKPNRLERYLNG